MTTSALFHLGPISVYEYPFNIISGYLFAKFDLQPPGDETPPICQSERLYQQ